MIDKQLIQQYAIKYNYSVEEVEKVINDLMNMKFKMFTDSEIKNMIESGLELSIKSS